MKVYIITSIMLLPVFSLSQNVGIGTTTPHASAQLEVSSTSKGILVPRMTQAQRLAVSNPAQGLLVYQTDGNVGFYENRSSIPAVPNWSVLTEGTNQWLPGATLNSIYNVNPGNVGIGTNTPGYPLTLQANGIGIAQQSPDGSTQVGFYTANGAAYLQTHSNHDLNFSTNNGPQQLTLKTTGNFGIGNSNPTSKLAVYGTFTATGNAVIGGTLQIQGGSPAAGRVLTSDASGNATWQAPDAPTCMLNSFQIQSSASYVNFVVPAGVTKVFVQMWGSGGDGTNSGTLAVVNGGGGGGGAYASFYLPVTPGATITGKIRSTDGSSTYSVFKYNGDSVRCLDGFDATIFGPGAGGHAILGGANFTLTTPIYNSKGQDGTPNMFSSTYTVSGFTGFDMIGGNGGCSYESYGQRGQVTRVSSGTGTETTKAELSNFKGYGAGGGAITRSGGTTTGNNTGNGGVILIYY